MGRVLLVSEGEGGEELVYDPLFFDGGEKGTGADAVIEVACDPLANEIARLVGLYECLASVDVWDVVEGIPVDWKG